MNSMSNRYKPSKLVKQYQKSALQIAISVAKGFAYSAESNDFSERRVTR